MRNIIKIKIGYIFNKRRDDILFLYIYNRDYMHHLQNGVMDDLHRHRRKRQAGIMGGPKKKLPVRKEIRMMSEKELELFFRAVNSAKTNRVSPIDIAELEYAQKDQFRVAVNMILSKQ